MAQDRGDRQWVVVLHRAGDQHIAASRLRTDWSVQYLRMTAPGEDELRALVRQFAADHDPAGDRAEFLRARFDAGLAWVHFPVGLGGLGLARATQSVVDSELAAHGAPDNDPRRIGIGLGMAAPTILAHGTDEQRRRWLRPLWTGEQVWCQLFSEPGAGSDLAALGTRAVRDGDEWIVN